MTDLGQVLWVGCDEGKNRGKREARASRPEQLLGLLLVRWEGPSEDTLVEPGGSADLGGGARVWPSPLEGWEDQDGAPGLLVP